MSNSEVSCIEGIEQLAEKLREEKKKNLSDFTKKSVKNLISLVPYADKLAQFHEDYENYSNNNEINRLVQFFYGINYQDNPNILIALGPEYAEQIIDCVMKDNEDDKLYYYKNLVLNINNHSLTSENKKDITTIIKQLSVRDIELARKYYIHENFDIKGCLDRKEGASYLSDSEDGFVIKSINSLISNGVIMRVKEGTWMSRDTYKGTSILKILIELIYETDKLKPSIIGKECKNKFDLSIALKNIDIKHKLIIKDIEDRLSENCRLEIIAINDSDYWHLSNNAKYFLALRKVLSGQELYEIALFDNIDYVKSWYDGDDIIKKAISSTKVSSSYYISNCHNSNTENDKNSLLEYLDSIKHECSNNN